MSTKKGFNIFDWYFKGVNKDNDKLDVNALEKPNITNFFKVLWKKLGKLLSANLIFVFGNSKILNNFEPFQISCENSNLM